MLTPKHFIQWLDQFPIFSEQQLLIATNNLRKCSSGYPELTDPMDPHSVIELLIGSLCIPGNPELSTFDRHMWEIFEPKNATHGVRQEKIEGILEEHPGLRHTKLYSELVKLFSDPVYQENVMNILISLPRSRQTGVLHSPEIILEYANKTPQGIRFNYRDYDNMKLEEFENYYVTHFVRLEGSFFKPIAQALDVDGLHAQRISFKEMAL